MATVQYDPEVVQQFADGLYKRAKQIVVAFTIVGALLGLFIGGAAADTMGAILGLVILGGIGYYFGTQRVFALKLMAQQALCQVQIEKNTRA